MADPVTVLGDAGAGIIYFKSFGVPMWVGTNRAEVLERLPEVLPPVWETDEGTATEHRLAILGDERGTYAVDAGGVFLVEGISLDLALEAMTDAIRARVAHEAPDKIFIHAGVVRVGDSALVLPAHSFAGKTTLVAALVRAGAVYYSDEFAPIDEDGLVHPYAKPLSVRGEDLIQRDKSVESLGGTVGKEPLRVGAVVAAPYRPGAEWRPERLSEGKGALALLSHTVPARDRPDQALRAIKRAVQGAILLEGERGEVEDFVPRLLSDLEARAV